MVRTARANPIRVIFELFTALLLLVVSLNYETLADQYALRTFHPSAATMTVINQLGLTDQARGVLYRAQAVVEDKVSFNRDCQTTPQELELGCYFKGHIYVLDITNQSLAPEMVVAMAHELLHAEWARYSAGEKASLGNELEKVYSGLNDPNLTQRMSMYAQSEPGQQTNELHSILGTEEASLPADLEQHYSAYFLSRPAIVADHADYTAVFSNQSALLARELSQIKSQKAQLASLNAEMTDYRNAGNAAAYNALVPRQNALADEINHEISVYSQGVAEYNALAVGLNSQAIATPDISAQ